jgi:hypothetical protein
MVPVPPGLRHAGRDLPAAVEVQVSQVLSGDVPRGEFVVGPLAEIRSPRVMDTENLIEAGSVAVTPGGVTASARAQRDTISVDLAARLVVVAPVIISAGAAFFRGHRCLSGTPFGSVNQAAGCVLWVHSLTHCSTADGS